MVNQYFNTYFISINCYFVMSSAYSTVVPVKSFKMALYMPKTEVREAGND